MALRLIVCNLLLLDAMNEHNQQDVGRRATNTASQRALHSERRALHAEEHRSDANQRRRLANAVGQPGRAGNGNRYSQLSRNPGTSNLFPQSCAILSHQRSLCLGIHTSLPCSSPRLSHEEPGAFEFSKYILSSHWAPIRSSASKYVMSSRQAPIRSSALFRLRALPPFTSRMRTFTMPVHQLCHGWQPVDASSHFLPISHTWTAPIYAILSMQSLFIVSMIVKHGAAIFDSAGVDRTEVEDFYHIIAIWPLHPSSNLFSLFQALIHR